MNARTVTPSATPSTVEIKPDKGGRNRSGCLVKRGKTWFLQVMVAGRMLRKSLGTSDRRKAERRQVRH